MTDKPITSLEDARHLKRAGLPLNMPVEKRTFSQKYSEHWFALMDAHGRFMLAVHKFADDQTAVRWWSVQRRYVALDRAAIRCLDLVHELGGREAEPVFKSEQDEHEIMRCSHGSSPSGQYPSSTSGPTPSTRWRKAMSWPSSRARFRHG